MNPQSTMTTMTALSWLALSATLCALAWVPYVLARLGVLGIPRIADNPEPGTAALLPPWAQRARQAHANLVENMVVVTPLVLIAAAQGSAAQPAIVNASMLFFISRVIYHVVYTAGVPWLRTFAFLGGFAAQVWLVISIFGGLGGR